MPKKPLKLETSSPKPLNVILQSQASEDKEAKKAWEAAKRAKQMDKLKEMWHALVWSGSSQRGLKDFKGLGVLRALRVLGVLRALRF